MNGIYLSEGLALIVDIDIIVYYLSIIVIIFSVSVVQHSFGWIFPKYFSLQWNFLLEEFSAEGETLSVYMC